MVAGCVLSGDRSAAFGGHVADFRLSRVDRADWIARVPTLHPRPGSWTAGLKCVISTVIQLPKRPPPSSRGMLIFCAIVVVSMLGVLLFLNRAGAQKSNDPLPQPSSMTSPLPSNQTSTKPSADELKKKLTPEQYHVTQQCGTETAFRNEYWDNQRPGIYVDVITGLPLFSSTDKFDAGTGRPTFTKPISPDRVFEKPDTSHDMQRTEVRATMSDSHLGHLFNDPTTPTGKRYAVNSAAFHFIPLEKMEAEGYAEYLSLFPKSGSATATPQGK